MGKREWNYQRSVEFKDGTSGTAALWAIVERLEALIGIGDNLEEVADLWANSLAFGGQPVGGIDQHEPATRGEWMCDKDKKCIFMKGHGGICLHEPPRYCQCVKPVFVVAATVDEWRDCTKCGLRER